MTYQGRIKAISILLMVGAIVGFVMLQSNAPKVYEGLGEGFNSEIKIKASIYKNAKKELRFAKIEVEHGDTPAIADPAMQAMVEKVMQAQSLDVELVAGASYSSGCFLEALKDAVSKVEN